MDKLITFAGVSETGEPLVQSLFPRSAEGPKVKLAFSSTLAPEMSGYVRALKPNPLKVYVLVNALGAGEYYGSNINGDYFEEKELNPAQWQGLGLHTAEYGYKTFHRAGIFRHHRNKDMAKSYGTVVFSIYNPRMHRVELIIEIDRAKAREMGHQDLLDELDAGKNPAVSMGCRVKFDVCSICGNRSKTRNDYCIHTKTMMNTVLPDGRKVFVYNPHPKFFDLSFVIIGADRTSYSMAKVASVGLLMSEFGGLSADQADRWGLRARHDLSHLKSKLGMQQKGATILKRIPAVAQKLRPQMEGMEPDLGYGLLRQLGQQPLGKVLTTSSAAGMVLKPIEYQTITLIRIKRPVLARKLHSAGQHFKPVDTADNSVGVGGVSEYSSLIRDLLRHAIPGRTILGDSLEKRAHVNPRQVSEVEANSSLLNKIAAGYNGYRIQLLTQMGPLAEQVTKRDSELLSTVFNSALEDELSGLGKAAGVPAAVFGALPLAFLYGAHVRKARSTGKKPGVVDRFVEQHPVLATSILVGLTRFGSRLAGQGAFSRLLNAAVNKLP